MSRLVVAVSTLLLFGSSAHAAVIFDEADITSQPFVGVGMASQVPTQVASANDLPVSPLTVSSTGSVITRIGTAAASGNISLSFSGADSGTFSSAANGSFSVLDAATPKGATAFTEALYYFTLTSASRVNLIYSVLGFSNNDSVVLRLRHEGDDAFLLTPTNIGTYQSGTLMAGDYSFSFQSIADPDYTQLTSSSTLDTNVTFQISDAVPEPASWVMMIAGIGMAGVAMRRRHTVTRMVRFA